MEFLGSQHTEELRIQFWVPAHPFCFVIFLPIGTGLWYRVKDSVLIPKTLSLIWHIKEFLWFTDKHRVPLAKVRPSSHHCYSTYYQIFSLRDLF